MLFYNNYKIGDKYFRLSFSSVKEDEMKKGITCLREVFQELYEELGIY